MRKSELLALLSRLDMHPSKKLGQNFLVDENCLAALVRAAAPKAGEHILEIGPGTGVMTERLLAAGCIVTAVEFDTRLAGYLREHFADNPNFTLVEGDACKVDYATLFPVGVSWRCISNLPYSCASVIMARLTESPNPPQAFHVLLQKEMAERLNAAVGTKDYGVLTVRLAFEYRSAIVRIVPHGVFFPPPEVDSAFLELMRRAETPPPAEVKRAGSIAAVAFTQRRKQSRTLLQKAYKNTDFSALFASLSIPQDARAENITPPQYLAMARRTIADE